MSYQSWSVVFSEQPSAAKWNILGSNDAHFYSFLGDNLAWASWTPTLSGRFNNTKWDKDCTYIQVGKTVFYKIRLIANTTTPMDGGTAEAIFTLPVTAYNYSTVYPSAVDMPILGNVRILDSGTAVFYGASLWTTTTTAKIVVYNAVSTYLQGTSIASTVPMTWTTVDEIFIMGTYEAA
jgi:hypothetical protein